MTKKYTICSVHEYLVSRKYQYCSVADVSKILANAAHNSEVKVYPIEKIDDEHLYIAVKGKRLNIKAFLYQFICLAGSCFNIREGRYIY